MTFNRILQFDWLTATQEAQFCQIWDWWWNISHNISFNFRSFPRKINDKIFQKIQKTFIWDHFGPFCPNLGKNEFSWKRALPVFKYSNYLPSCQKSEKKLITIPEKNTELMDWQTSRQWSFYRTLHRTGDKNTAKESKYLLYSVSFFQMYLPLVNIHKNITNLKMGEKFKNLTVVPPDTDGYQTYSGN